MLQYEICEHCVKASLELIGYRKGYLLWYLVGCKENYEPWYNEREEMCECEGFKAIESTRGKRNGTN